MSSMTRRLEDEKILKHELGYVDRNSCRIVKDSKNPLVWYIIKMYYCMEKVRKQVKGKLETKLVKVKRVKVFRVKGRSKIDD